MKNCELCKLQARTYCESDQASLCWDCDAKVHTANFLVARHSRTLLCHLCHSLTPWKATGEKLGQTVSVCDSCISGQEEESRETNGDENDDDDEEEMEVEEEEGENQVVPWSTITDTPPPAYTSSSSEEISDSVNVFPLKRRRGNASDLSSQYDQDGSSSERKYGEELLTTSAASVDSQRSSQNREMEPYRSKSAAIIVEPLKRYRNQRNEGELSDVNSWGSCSRPI
ncbi:Zinc finger, B-box [Melia azedarach]|uniref:Zinc finger, B-box n=1 Tax=Melia azedarach TaxID=155640 RepID=A0ACC1Z1S9_MELAZ|nr:Zinc finger, B-box [Melia azedarach]